MIPFYLVYSYSDPKFYQERNSDIPISIMGKNKENERNNSHDPVLKISTNSCGIQNLKN